MSEPWHEAERLQKLYEDDGLSVKQIADKFGVTHSTIEYWMDKHGIERRSRGEAMRMRMIEITKDYPSLQMSADGYCYWSCKLGGSTKSVAVHQLLAIANGADPWKVFSDGDYQVHHIIPIPWLNTPDNVRLLSRREHSIADNLRRLSFEQIEKAVEASGQNYKITKNQ